jgi:WD40 repeat protein
MTAIFISHRSTDDDDAATLKVWLAKHGYERIFLDFDPMDGIPAGVDWEDRIYTALRSCDALLVVLTPDWLASPWCVAERVIAREKGKKIFVARTKAVAAGSVTASLQEVDLTRDRRSGLEKLRRGLLEEGMDPSDSFARDPSRAVFPGLEAFDVEDAGVFFGRREESRGAAEKLRALRWQPSGTPKLLLITGASGSGKSSLMRAGVIARLRKERHAWITTRPFRRNLDAVGSLATALAWSWPKEQRTARAKAIRKTLERRGLLPVADQLRLLTDRPEATVILALDQGEELLVADERSSALLDLLREALSRSTREIMAVVTIRSDQLGLWQAHPAITEGHGHGALLFESFPLGPMPIDRVPELVRKPAELIDLKIDDELVDAIRADTSTPDALPLLAYTLRELHEQYGDNNQLRLTEYNALGRLEGAVRTRANDAVRSDVLLLEDREALRGAFVPTMVRATDDGGFVREPALLHSVESRASPFVRRLIDARLLKAGIDAQGRPTVEIAHESLLRAWPLLAGWLAEDQHKLAALATLKRSALAWKDSGFRGDHLDHRDQRLHDLREQLSERRWSDKMDDQDRSYLDACQVEQNKRTRRRRLVQQLSAVASILLLALSIVAGLQWRLAVRAEATAEERRVQAELSARRALSEAARAQAEQARAENALLREQAARREALAAEMEEGFQRAHRIAAIGKPLAAGRLALQLLADLRRNPPAANLSATVERQIEALAIASANKLRSSKLCRTHSSTIWYHTFSPDGKYLVYTTSDGNVHQSRTSDCELVRTISGHGDIVSYADWDSKTNRIVTSSWDRTIMLYDIAQGARLRTMEGHKARVTKAVFSHAGRYVASASADGVVIVWDAISGQELDRYELGRGAVAQLFFSLDENYLFTLGANDSPRIWTVRASKDTARQFSGHSERVNDIALSSDNSLLLSGSADKTARLWSTENGTQLKASLAHDESVISVSFTRDDRYVATTTDKGLISLFDLQQDLKRISTFSVPNQASAAIQLVLDGSIVITSEEGRTVGLRIPELAKIFDADGPNYVKHPVSGIAVKSLIAVSTNNDVVEISRFVEDLEQAREVICREAGDVNAPTVQSRDEDLIDISSTACLDFRGDPVWVPTPEQESNAP